MNGGREGGGGGRRGRRKGGGGDEETETGGSTSRLSRTYSQCVINTRVLYCTDKEHRNVVAGLVKQARGDVHSCVLQ